MERHIHTHTHTRAWATHLLDHRRHKERKREERAAEPWGRLLVKVNDLMKAKHEKRDRARGRVCLYAVAWACVRATYPPRVYEPELGQSLDSRAQFASSCLVSPSFPPTVHLRRISALEITFLVVAREWWDWLADVRNRMRVHTGRLVQGSHRDHGKCGHGQGSDIRIYRGKFSASTWSHFRWSLISGERIYFYWRAISIIFMKADEKCVSTVGEAIKSRRFVPVFTIRTAKCRALLKIRWDPYCIWNAIER